MKKMTTICDRCGKECPDQTIYLDIDEIRLPTGKTEPQYIGIDLCHTCLARALEKITKTWDRKQRVEWIRTLEKEIKR